MQKAYIEVEVTKTASKDGIEYSHVKGPSLISTWVESSELKDVNEPKELKDVKEPKELKDVKEPKESKDVKEPKESK